MRQFLDVVHHARAESGQIEFPVDQMTRDKREGAMEHLPLKVYRDHLQSVVGVLKREIAGLQGGDAELS
jgi:hypothetical protein